MDQRSILIPAIKIKNAVLDGEHLEFTPITGKVK